MSFKAEQTKSQTFHWNKIDTLLCSSTKDRGAMRPSIIEGTLRIQKCKDSQHETLINTKAKTLCNISNYANYQP